MKTIIKLIALILFTYYSHAQISFEKYFGGATPKYISQNSDGGFVACFDTANGFSILKLNPCGDMVFYKNFQFVAQTKVFSVEQDIFGGYIVGGTVYDSTVCDANAFIFRLDGNGDTIVTKLISCVEFGSYGGMLLATPDSNFVFQVYQDDAAHTNFTEVIKLDQQLNEQWSNRTFSYGASNSSMFIQDDNSTVLSVSNFVVNGTFISKIIDSGGVTQATHSVYDTNYVDNYFSSSICPSNDSGYFIVGDYNNSYCVFKTNNQLDTIWSRKYLMPNYPTHNPLSVLQDADSGYFSLRNNFTLGSFELLHLNGDGDSLETISFIGQSGTKAVKMKKCSDGGFIILAQTNDSVTGLPTSYIVKTEGNGHLTSQYNTLNETICNGSGYLFNGNVITASGSYTDTLINSQGCDSIITLNLTMYARYNDTIVASICNSSSYVLPGGSVVTASGIYSDTLLSINGCDSVLTTDLNFYPVLVASVTPGIIDCHGDSTLVVVTVAGGTAPYTGSGVFNVPAGSHTFIVSDSNGCSLSQTISIIEPPALFANAGLSSSICQGDSMIIGANPTGTGGSGVLNYQWTPSSQLSSPIDSNPTAYPSQTTTFQVLVTDANGCMDSSSVLISIISNPIPIIFQFGDTLFTNSVGIYYEWFFNNSLLFAGNFPYIIVNQTGDYQVIVHNTIGCANQSALYPYVVNSILKLKDLSDFVVKPNPAQSILRIYFMSGNINNEWCLYDPMGKIIFSGSFNNEELYIDISTLSDGLYFIAIKNSNQVFTRRIMVGK